MRRKKRAGEKEIERRKERQRMINLYNECGMDEKK